MACLVLKPEMAFGADELIAFCRQSLASYKISRRIIQAVGTKCCTKPIAVM